MELLLGDIVKAVGGKCLNPSTLDGKIIEDVNTDSRKNIENSLFIPLKGDNFDGHQFISTVFEKGARATLTQEEVIKDERLCTIYVKNTSKALLDLAYYYRSQFNIPIIGVTGSVGKTSTKDIIAAILSGKFNVHKTEGNYNNEIGLPLTLFKLKKEHEVAVIEMGMNHFGEIHRLSQTANPEMGIITNVGTSHIENLGSREGILKAKLEILDGLKEEGLLILNGDNDLLGTLENLPVNSLKYGLSNEYPYYAKDIKCHSDFTSAIIVTPRETYEIKIAALGEHMIYNTLAGIAVAEHCGLTKEEIFKGIDSYVPTKMRMHIETYDNGITIMNDAYNASPDSMEAALKVLQNYNTVGKKIAVLGDMLEMGEFAPMLHEQVGQFAATMPIDTLCLVGKLARYIYEGATKAKSSQTILYYETKEGFIKEMKKVIASGDTVLFKASRGMKFEEMIEELGKVNENEK